MLKAGKQELKTITRSLVKPQGGVLYVIDTTVSNHALQITVSALAQVKADLMLGLLAVFCSFYAYIKEYKYIYLCLY